MSSLFNRYLKTKKGRLIIGCTLLCPIKLDRKFKNGVMLTQIGNRLVCDNQADEYQLEYHKQQLNNSKIKYNLTDDDFNLSEEKLAIIVAEELAK